MCRTTNRRVALARLCRRSGIARRVGVVSEIA
jgi:hypothetical protein